MWYNLKANLLRRAIEKYGFENFKKEILEYCGAKIIVKFVTCVEEESIKLKTLFSNIMYKCYHLSPIKNRESILNEGLKLQSGERSKRFGQHDERLYVVDRLWKVLRLVNCTMFNTHPDFKNGFDLYEVEVKDKNVDEKWELGSFTTITPRNVKYCCTIEIGEGKDIIVRRTNREQLLSIRRGE